MTEEQFDKWFKDLKETWETRNPKKASDLCAEKLFWYETPFDKPLKNRREIVREWQGVLNQEDISVSYDIISVKNDIGIAHWTASFTRLPSKIKAKLDGIFEVRLNQKGECIEFHQWYNSKE